MSGNFVASAHATINSPVSKVWDALLDPAMTKQYMFGTEVVSDFREGSSIMWRGVWKGKAYEDRGTILKLEKERLLRYSHFSPLSGLPDIPESYHTVTIELSAVGGHTLVSLSQDNNVSEDSRDHSQKNWQLLLDGLKQLLESK